MAAQQPPQTDQEEILNPHVPEEESLKASAVGAGQITAVTDRRVISVTQVESETEEQREVESVLLTSNRVVGTQYGRTDSENRATLQRIAGVILGIIGALVFLAGLQADTGQGGLLLLGFIAIGVGVALYWLAQDTVEGGVSITVRRAGEIPDRTWSFPRGQTEVPQMISKQVAKIHGPD